MLVGCSLSCYRYFRMSHDTNELDRLLAQMASDSKQREIDSNYSEVGPVMKEAGCASNNMLLRTLCSESKRCSDAVSRLDSRIARIEHNVIAISSSLSKLCTLMETQNTIISSQINSTNDMQSYFQSSQAGKVVSENTSWYYQGVKLTSKYKICACIISHLIELVRLKMENSGTYYPDSVDASFTVVEYCVRESAKMRCLISAVGFKDEIKIPDTSKSSAAYESILPLIASHNSSAVTNLLESRLSELCTPITRPIMEAVSRIVQRMCYIERLLSPQQIDILKSLQFPVCLSKDEDQCALNWNPSCIKPRNSNPMSVVISDYTPTQKSAYIKYIMKSMGAAQASVSAAEQK